MNEKITWRITRYSLEERTIQIIFSNLIHISAKLPDIYTHKDQVRELGLGKHTVLVQYRMDPYLKYDIPSAVRNIEDMPKWLLKAVQNHVRNQTYETEDTLTNLANLSAQIGAFEWPDAY